MEENNKNVIVIQNEEDNKEKNPKRLTFSKYWHYVAKFRYWIIGLTLFFTVLSYLFSFIYLNPKSRVLTSTFTLNFPLQQVINENITNNSDNSDNIEYTYFDGTTFSYQSIISNDSLNYVMNNTFTDDEKTNKKYSFSLEKINDYNAISIQQATNTVNNNNVAVIPNKYIITATVKYLGNNSTIAKDFISDLLKRANEIAVEKLSTSSLLKTLPNSISSLSYESTISQLSKQYNLITESYSELEKNVSSNLIFEDNISLRMRKSDLTSKYNTSSTNTIFDDLKNEKSTRCFYKYDINRNLDDVINEVEIKAINDSNGLENIQKQITDKKDAISSYNRTDGDSKLSEYYIQLNNELEQLQEQARNYQASIDNYGYSSDGNYVDGSILDNLNKAKTGNHEWVEANQSFNTKLDNYYNMLKTDADKANSDYIYVYKTASNGVLYDIAGIATIDGEINDFIVAAVGLVLGYLLSSIICAYIGNHKDNTKEDNQNKKDDKSLPEEIKEEPSSFVISSEDK